MATQEYTDILAISEDEVRAIIRNNSSAYEAIASTLSQIVSTCTLECESIDRALSDYTARSSLMMTIAGLLAFVPSIAVFSTDYLEYYLIWTFPYLLASLVIYYLSSERVVGLVRDFPAFSVGSENFILKLRAEARAKLEIWKRCKSNHDKSQVFFSIFSATMMTYFLSFSVNLYHFAFWGEPILCESVAYTLIFIGIGVILAVRPRMKSMFNINFRSP